MILIQSQIDPRPGRKCVPNGNLSPKLLRHFYGVIRSALNKKETYIYFVGMYANLLQI